MFSHVNKNKYRVTAVLESIVLCVTLLLESIDFLIALKGVAVCTKCQALSCIYHNMKSLKL